MALPTFRIFNGHSRGLGQDAKMSIYMQMSVGFRDYLFHFRGAQLAAFIFIALSSNEEGWSEPSLEAMSEATGYGIDTLSQSIAKLCERTIEGSRVLLVHQPRDKHGLILNNRYLIFPTPDEVQRWESEGKYTRQVQSVVVVPDDGQPDDEAIGLFTRDHDARIAGMQTRRELPQAQPVDGLKLVQGGKPKRAPRTKKATDPLHHVVKEWWQSPLPGPNRVIVDFGKDGKSIERIVAAIRGLKWEEEYVADLLQECFKYYTTNGPKDQVEFWAPKLSLGTMPERLQVWYNTVKLANMRQVSRSAVKTVATNRPIRRSA